ncbi:MAG: hypothetical protein GY862_38040 [Gammaproteobacteria bacterium]|nr:hypothetical protein [Gammaproteobacteria bacterium]
MNEGELTMFIPHKRKLLAAIISAVCLSVLTQEASAASVPLNDSPVGVNIGSVNWPSADIIGPVAFAKELADTNVTLAAPAATKNLFNIALNGGVNNTKPGEGLQAFFVKLYLSDGATFEGTSTDMFIHCASATTNPGSGAMSGDLNMGGGGSDEVIFQVSGDNVKAINPLKSGCVVHLDAGTNALIGVNGTQEDITISGHVEYWAGAQVVVDDSQNGTYITFVQGLFDWYKPNVSSTETGTINVQSASLYLLEDGAQRVTARLGYVRYGHTSTVSAYNASGNMMYASGVADGSTTFSVTVSGVPVAGAKTVILMEESAVCGANTILASTAGAQFVNFTGLTPTQISAGATICLTFDGVTEIPEGQTYASISIEEKLTSAKPIFKGPQPLLKFAKNGSRFRVLTIAGDQSSELTVHRFYNAGSTNPASVRCTLYNMDGSMIGTAMQELVSATELVPNAAIVKCGSDGDLAGLKDYCTNQGSFQTVFGTSWTGRAWAQCMVDSDEVEVMTLNRTVDGVLTNLSAGATKVE